MLFSCTCLHLGIELLTEGLEVSFGSDTLDVCNSGGTGASGVIQIEDASGNKEEHFLEDGFLNYLNKVYAILDD
jgi:hypothetical protein